MAQLKPEPRLVSKKTTPENYYSLDDLQNKPQSEQSEKFWTVVAKGLTKIFKGMRNNQLNS